MGTWYLKPAAVSVTPWARPLANALGSQRDPPRRMPRCIAGQRGRWGVSRPVGRVLSPLFSCVRDLGALTERLADPRFQLSSLLNSSCAFSRSGGTATELADLGPPVALTATAGEPMSPDPPRESFACAGGRSGTGPPPTTTSSKRRGRSRFRNRPLAWVELRGFEPLAPSMRTRCATGLRYSPENL
jgi:hypothetical protein